VLGTSTNATKDGDKDTPPEAQDADMLWNYETMASRAPSELAEEDYVELMLAMERTLYDDLLAEMRAQGTAVHCSPPRSHVRYTSYPSVHKLKIDIPLWKLIVYYSIF